MHECTCHGVPISECPNVIARKAAEQAEQQALFEVETPDLLFKIGQQAHADSDRWFPHTQHNLGYKVLCLAGEVGEVANLVKKIERGSITYLDVEEDIRNELADVFTYLIELCGTLNIDLLDEYISKRDYNEKRFGNGSVQGT